MAPPQLVAGHGTTSRPDDGVMCAGCDGVATTPQELRAPTSTDLRARSGRDQPHHRPDPPQEHVQRPALQSGYQRRRQRSAEI